MPNWFETFQAALPYLSWWSGGSGPAGQPFVIDGVETTFSGQWIPTGDPDPDGDGIPNAIDRYPDDATNNSYWWGGNGLTNVLEFQGRRYVVRSQWFAGNGADSSVDPNGIPECMEPMLSNLSNPQLQHWLGITVALNGAFSTFEELYYFGADTGDIDGDGIPNEIDPQPNNPWNGSLYYWGGGDFFINGNLTHFDPGWRTGMKNDEDRDTIPDEFDPAVSDPSNNSQWWEGGSWLINGTLTTFLPQYRAADAPDTDGDGIHDGLDDYPSDPHNNNVQWNGGDFRIDGAFVHYAAQWIGPNEGDTDGDDPGFHRHPVPRRPDE